MTSDPSAADIYGRDFPAGTVVFEEGDPGGRMYVIRSGEVPILKRAVDACLRFVDLRARWHALAARELLARGPEEIATELLEARLPPDEAAPGAGAPGGLEQYLASKRRFEPGERGRNPT
jgi:CRP-like cAMP-binding protein